MTKKSKGKVYDINDIKAENSKTSSSKKDNKKTDNDKDEYEGNSLRINDNTVDSDD